MCHLVKVIMSPWCMSFPSSNHQMFSTGSSLYPDRQRNISPMNGLGMRLHWKWMAGHKTSNT